jgi:hypothetical protein
MTDPCRIVKHRLLLSGLAFILLLAAGWIWWFTSKQDTASRERVGDSVPPARQIRSRLLSNGSAAPAAAEPAADGGLSASGLNPDSREAILAEIEEASVTYDAAALPRIERFLLHPDPKVRESARNGMIVLGDAAAGPLLREASRRTTDSQEVIALLQAADYVELPSAPPKRHRRSSVLQQQPGR